MSADAVAARIAVRQASYHFHAKSRLVIRVGEDKYFLALTSGDGATVIYEAIDEDGTVGGDWWGQVDAASREQALQIFAMQNAVSLDGLWAAIHALESPRQRPWDAAVATIDWNGAVDDESLVVASRR